MTINYEISWTSETPQNTIELTRQSFAAADSIVCDDDCLHNTTVYYNKLLVEHHNSSNHQDKADILNSLFDDASESMETESDRNRIALLKNYVSCLIGTSLGVPAFLPGRVASQESDQGSSWADIAAKNAPQKTTTHFVSHYRVDVDDQAERREHTKFFHSLESQYNNDEEFPEDYNGFEPDFLPDLPSDTFCMPIFFPSERSYRTFLSVIKSAQETLHICVFSLTDNTTAKAVAQAARRGVDVKIITDNDQLECKGSDVERLAQEEGIPFKTDNSDQFMHNKFAVVDKKIVLTGSFNWSIGARYKNKENVIITNIKSVVESFDAEFDKLWDSLE